MKRDMVFWLALLALAGGGGAVVYQKIRGLRNNNPGNIRSSKGTTWVGQTGVDSKGFVVFSSMEYGVRAVAIILRNYVSKYGLQTVAQIINRWAPPSENDTAAYTQFVAGVVGVEPGAPVDWLNDDEAMRLLIRAISRQENGPPALLAVSDATIQRGLSMAA